MYIKDYIQATYEVLQEGREAPTTLSALTRYLKSRGLMKLYPSILRGLMEKIQRSGKSTKTRVMVAREEDAEKHAKEIKKFLTELDTHTDYDLKISPDLIGGFIIQSKSVRIDQSHKNKLLQAYHRLTI